jgi:predicted DNA-binding protein (UPF0251 family)
MRGRPKIKRTIRFFPEITYFKPAGIPLRELSEVILPLDEVEAIRLAELEDLDQEEAAKKMKISRITFQRILHRAHKKIAESLIYGKALRIEGGEIMAYQSRLGKALDKELVSDTKRTWGRNVGRGQGLGGSDICICPNCKKEIPHRRGIPCIQQECPDCKVALRGKFCR